MKAMVMTTTPTPAVSRMIKNAQKKPRLVLLIEDSPSQALWLRLLLERAGYEVTVANDGAKGWCRACSEHPDLILLDINLPRIDGFGLLYLLKQCYITATIPVVMLTILDRISDVEYAITLGADGYLFKDDYLLKKDGAQHIVDAVDQLVETS